MSDMEYPTFFLLWQLFLFAQCVQSAAQTADNAGCVLYGGVVFHVAQSADVGYGRDDVVNIGVVDDSCAGNYSAFCEILVNCASFGLRFDGGAGVCQCCDIKQVGSVGHVQFSG